jgi:hypothetical protein
MLKEYIEKINKAEINPEILSKLSCNDDFNKLSFDLLKEVGSYLIIGSSIMPKEELLNRDQAIIVGNAVRLYKLISLFLDQKSKKREEVLVIIARLVFESIVNLSYLITNHSKELFDSYVIYSLQNDKKLYDKIYENIKNRDEERILRIEDRMLKSIKRNFDKSEVRIEDYDEKIKN